MNDDIKHNKKLIEKYPFLAVKENEEKIDYEITLWDDIPIGWRKAFGEQMCDELLEILKKSDCLDDYRIFQIKEKFGMLRIYDNGIPSSIHDEYNAWLNKYEELSEKTCIICGNPATTMTKGWVMPVCNEHKYKYYK